MAAHVDRSFEDREFGSPGKRVVRRQGHHSASRVKFLFLCADIGYVKPYASLLEFLRATQNPDGGWGYFAGKQSWLEPTVYAALALHGDPDSTGAVTRAWRLAASWQNPDGGWRPCAVDGASTWVTALGVTLGDVIGHDTGIVDAGVRWLTGRWGAESSLVNRILRGLGVSAVEREVKFRGWPWRANTTAWVEPTAHSLVALRRAARTRKDAAILERIRSGEKMLESVRCADGGWNYGSPRALGVDLPSYIETTAIALVGLGRAAPPDAVEYAQRRRCSPEASPLARAWLNIALRVAGVDLTESGTDAADRDVMLIALAALGGERGNWRLLSAGVGV
jgi:hypothetical protein